MPCCRNRWFGQAGRKGLCVLAALTRTTDLIILVVQYLGVLKVNLWDSKGNILTQKG